MIKQKVWFLCLVIISILSSSGFVLAAEYAPSVAIRQVQAQVLDPAPVQFTLKDLGFADMTELRTPYQAISKEFSLPSDWLLVDDVTLALRLTSTFQSLMEAFTSEELSEDVPDRFGIVAVLVNGKKISEERITGSGSLVLEFVMPTEVFLYDGQPNILTISWDASAACRQSITADVVIDGASLISFPEAPRAISPSMRNFPAPFFMPNALAAYPIAVILPPDPDGETMSALASVAAGFGRQSSAQVDLEVFFADATPTSVLEDHHIILVGKDADLQTVFSTLKVSDAPTFRLPDGGGEGVLTLLPSMWNDQRALLIVSGVDGSALRKSAAAVAADGFFTTASGNQAVISEVVDPLESKQWQIDRSFTALFDRAEITSDKLGMQEVHLPFHVPADISLSPEAYIELYFRHSQLINYLQSSISVALNGKTIGTIRFGDQTATNGLARIILPPNSVRPLRNELTLTFTLIPQDICADERSGNYWVTIFGDSYLHLPPVFEESPLAERVYLDGLRNTFFGSSTFSDLSFVLGENDVVSMQFMVDLAGQLGAITLANQMQPAAQLIDPLLLEGNENSVLIMIAHAEQVAAQAGLNAILSLPFATDGTLAQIDTKGVSFSLNADQDYGILQLVKSDESARPWLLVSGNSNTGVGLALESILSKLQTPLSARANVEVINAAGDMHAFLFEKDVVESTNGSAQTNGWKQIFSGNGSNRLALVLMIPALLITAIYILWMMRHSHRK